MEFFRIRDDSVANGILFGAIFFLFLVYRGYFWMGDLPAQLDQVLMNVSADTLMVYGLHRLLGWLSARLERARMAFLFFWLAGATVGSMIQVQVHYAVHEWTDSFTEEFRRTFALFTFQIFDSYVVVFCGLGISTAFTWYREWTNSQLALNQLQKEKARTELEYLKSQINPHFVFNTLNSIFFLIHPDNEQARTTLHRFSSLLRYQLYDSSSETVSIESEIAYLRNFIDLQRIRLDEHYEISFEVGEEVKEFSIAPLMLIVPLENAFKYLSHHGDKPNRVSVSLNMKDGFLEYRCSNSCSAREKILSGGIGLKNLIRRMELLFGQKAHLYIDKKEESYTITLSIPV